MIKRLFYGLCITLIITSLKSYTQSPPGSLDTTFGLDGTGTIIDANTGNNSLIHSIALQPNGVINVTGNDTNNSANIGIIASYQNDGTSNPAFNQGRPIQLGGGILNALAVRPDTTLVASGAVPINNNTTTNIYLNSPQLNGTPNLGFQANIGFGYHFSPPGTSSISRAIAVYPQTAGTLAGRIVAVGYSAPTTIMRHFALTRTLPDGRPDLDFGRARSGVDNGGRVETNFIGTADDFSQINGIALYPSSDNKIVVAGQALINGQQRFVLARYFSDGTLDQSFGQLVNPQDPFSIRTGKVITDFTPITLVVNRNDKANAVALQAINNEIKIVAVGSTPHRNGKPFFTLVRYNENGTLDRTFGYPGTGIRINCFGTIANEAMAVAIDSQNRIVVAGKATTGTPRTPLDQFIVARYTSNGNTDATFGTKGVVFTPFLGQGAGATSIAIQPDNKIIAAGYAIQNNHSHFALARYNG